MGMGSRPAPGCAGGIGNVIGAGIGIGIGGPIPAGGGGGGKAMIGDKPLGRIKDSAFFVYFIALSSLKEQENWLNRHST